MSHSNRKWHYFRGAGPDSTDVVYAYGGPNETGDQIGNLAGRIKSVTDESGLEERFYGRLGETTKEYKQVNASNNPIMRKRYETRYVFDSFGRMKEMTYPDGEVLYYRYDTGGLLWKADGSKRGNPYSYVKELLYDEFGQRTSLAYGNNVVTQYTYDPLSRWLIFLGTTDGTGRTIQDITYDYDPVGNINWTNNAAPVPAGGEIGGPARQEFIYDDLYQLTTAVGYHLPSPGKRTQYTNNLTYDTIGNITRKLQTHLIIGSSGSTQEPAATNYDLWYKYTGIHPHAVTDAGDKLYAYDLNGNMTGWVSKANPNATRLIAWNEENRLKNITDSGQGVDFIYDDSGERVIKRDSGNETVYLNRFYALKNGDLGSKHIFANETRICTKIEKDGGSIQTGVPGTQGQALTIGNIQFANTRGNADFKRGIERRLQGATGITPSPPIEKFAFFYHGDHLGSSSFITDDAGAVYQHLEYFPYGETWVEDGGSGQMPYYRFTGKELDPETGLYYYGARYYDPVLSRWISADPILGKYLPTGDREKDKHLFGIGGVFNPINLALYSYAHLNPIKLVDPDGNDAIVFHGGFIGGPSGVYKLADRIRIIVNHEKPNSILLALPSIDYQGFITNKGSAPGTRYAEEYKHIQDPKILAGFSVGGDAALSAGGPTGGGQWDLRVVIGAQITPDMLNKIESASKNSKSLVLVNIVGDKNLANDPGVPSFIGDRFGDRSYEGLMGQINSKYGSLKNFYKAYPNVSIQSATGAHGGGGNRESTLNAVERGYKEIQERQGTQ